MSKPAHRLPHPTGWLRLRHPDFRQHIGHHQMRGPPAPLADARQRKVAGSICDMGKWWTGLDSNQRTETRADLQSNKTDALIDVERYESMVILGFLAQRMDWNVSRTLHQMVASLHMIYTK
ncbi:MULTISPECIES: hypothetical protein [unclassified Sphingopyxis]|uniref:hypothetical protein n=1 Tax=unclassified Sphingopyxis TaxID=2614943 RepID=UPI0012E33113|nr:MULTISPECIES: hypothetical protein [unclassified Sphingopyxis]